MAMQPFQGGVDLTSLVNTAQQTNVILSAILTALKNGLIISPNLPTFTVASLPSTATNGEIAFASNGRKSGEGGGAGTGIVVFWNGASSQWFGIKSEVLVTS